MPIYEFICQQCHGKTSIFKRSVGFPVGLECSRCGSLDLTNLISGFAYHKSMSTIHEESGEPGRNPPLDYFKDPRNIGRSVEKQFKDMGVDMPNKLKEDIKAAREGELPKELKGGVPSDASYH